jgi:CRISPR-associated protein Csd1
MIGDTKTLFWTEKKTNTESLFAKILNGGISEEPETTTTEDQAQHREIQALLTMLRRGGGASLTKLKDNPDTKFYILGLAKMNKSRVAVRFWHVSTIGQMLENLQDHYQNLALTRKKDSHPFWEPEFPSAQRILEETARNRDRKAIAPLLGGQLMQSIIHRSPYPLTLFQGILNRLKVVEKDQQGKTIERVPYLKAAILKAILIRNFNQTIEMSLNTERTEPAYLLGRLFAALEKTQEDALGKINAGIRERFYSSASATPGSVFPRILRTYQHHLSKLEGGMKTNRERLVQAIHAPLNAYPAYLTLEQQGMFAIGYYHQRQDFYTKKETIESKQPANV